MIDPPPPYQSFSIPEPLTLEDLISFCNLESELERMHMMVIHPLEGNTFLKGKPLRTPDGKRWYSDKGGAIKTSEVPDKLGVSDNHVKYLMGHMVTLKSECNRRLTRANYYITEKLRAIVNDSSWKINQSLYTLKELLEKSLLMECHKSIRSFAGNNLHKDGGLEKINVCNGVYFLKNDDTVVYVGKGCPAIARIGSHCVARKRTGWEFDSAVMLPMPGASEREILRREGHYIEQLQPLYNKQGCWEHSPLTIRKLDDPTPTN
jgi:hypothetical protein